jgi:hypothetical protein
MRTLGEDRSFNASKNLFLYSLRNLSCALGRAGLHSLDSARLRPVDSLPCIVCLSRACPLLSPSLYALQSSVTALRALTSKRVLNRSGTSASLYLCVCVVFDTIRGCVSGLRP